MTRRSFLPLFLAASLAANAEAKELTTVASFLKDDRGAHLAAMAGTGTAVNGDLFAVLSNPASLAGLNRYQAAFEHDAMILDISGNFASIGGPYGDHFALGLSYNGIDYGSTLKTTVADPFGSSNATFTGADQALGLSAGYRMGYYNNIYVGASYRYYELEIDRYNAYGHAFDVGAQWDVWLRDDKWSGLRLGASILNLGPNIAFRNTGEKVPTTWRVGGTYRNRLAGFDVEGSADIVGGHGEEAHGRLGVGVSPIDWLVVRGGFNSERDFASGLSGGLGVLWNDVNVDYAYIPYGDFGARHRISLAYSWGTPRQVMSPYARVEADRAAPRREPRRSKYETTLEREGLVPGQAPRAEIVAPLPEVRRSSRAAAPAPAVVAEPMPSAPPAPAPRATPPPRAETKPAESVVPAQEGPKVVRRASAPETTSGGPVVIRKADPVPPPVIVEQPLEELPRRATPSPAPAPLPSSPIAPAVVAPVPARAESADVKELLRMAAVMMERERYAEAIEQYRRAMAADPGSPRILYNMATAQFLAKNYNEAQASYRRVIDRQPGDAESWFYLGLCQFKLGDYDNAVTSWKRTVALDPNNEDARSYLSSLGE